ncbi:hypothetical protein LDENG_00190940, partial [Lucifuga dentata]
TTKRQHITPTLRSLHWLPVSQRTEFKILLLVYKALIGLGPKYISDLLLCYENQIFKTFWLWVCFLFLKSELNMGKQHLVSMHQLFGTNFQKVYSNHITELFQIRAENISVHYCFFY